ncbi:MAG: glycosyltransferase [Tildeniella nuda ZEHNDER 1965/U140]|jgi:glycosyltransferase involved in cell wall biosynthesis|nr:glycosyltransferase [Tildeniella nuda ZEHNDER 1965/U140]
MVNSFSVIVPVLNKENEIIRTLESIDASIAFFNEQYDGAQTVRSELIVVDEGSTDRTPALLAEFGRDKPYFQVIKHFRSLGIGPARNTGVKLAQGEILFFCDGDDLFFKEHIYLCFTLLNYQPIPADKASHTFEITIGDRSYPLTLPPHPVGIVRTGVHMQDPLYPYWKAAIENTLALNLCIRRECHEFIEGFPEAPVYKQIGGCEDVSYDLWMAKFFKVLKVEIETVEYIRYPGNNFDRQLKKFQTAPDRYQDETPPEETALHLLRRKLEQDRFSYLAEKFKKVAWNAAFVPILNWQQLAGDYLAQDCYLEAISLYEQGIVAEPSTYESVKNILAAAYNNFGSAFHKQGDLEHAGLYFKKAIDLNPTLSHSDFARVHFNLGTVLYKQTQFEQAMLYLQKAVALQPDFTEAIAELSTVKNQFQLITKGYQFSSSAAVDFTPLASYFDQFKPVALNALAIGSDDGRITCWLLDNVLLQPDATITCVDRFEKLSDGQPILERFEANIARTGAAEKVHKIAGQPHDVLRSQPFHSYQLIYIGSMTTASETLEIAVLSWGCLTVGGVIVFADYELKPLSSMTDMPPKSAIDAFMTLFSSKLKRLYQGSQVLLEKIAD